MATLQQRRRALLERHSLLAARHRAASDRAAQLVELREHHEELQEHHAALAQFQTELQHCPPNERLELSLAEPLEAAEVMLVESGRAVEEARQAWRRATDVYQKVRSMLRRDE